MEINIISQVTIEVTQEDVEKMIRGKIEEQTTDVTVDSIEFITKRNPTRLGIEVMAHIGNAPAEQGELELAPSEELADEEPVKEPVKESESIFGDH